jgi:3-oxoacyl-[acyl-carrier protein] reductase
VSADVDRLFSETKRIYGRVDIVVANAAVLGQSPIHTTTNEEFDRLFNINVKGVFYVLRNAANHVEKDGRIVVLGSVLKTGTNPGYKHIYHLTRLLVNHCESSFMLYSFGPYGATKAAIEVLANTLAQELGAKGITVNTIHPGYTETDMIADYVTKPEVRAFMASVTPFKRIGGCHDHYLPRSIIIIIIIIIIISCPTVVLSYVNRYCCGCGGFGVINHE